MEYKSNSKKIGILYYQFVSEVLLRFGSIDKIDLNFINYFIDSHPNYNVSYDNDNDALKPYIIDTPNRIELRKVSLSKMPRANNKGFIEVIKNFPEYTLALNKIKKKNLYTDFNDSNLSEKDIENIKKTLEIEDSELFFINERSRLKLTSKGSFKLENAVKIFMFKTVVKNLGYGKNFDILFDKYLLNFNLTDPNNITDNKGEPATVFDVTLFSEFYKNANAVFIDPRLDIDIESVIAEKYGSGIAK